MTKDSIERRVATSELFSGLPSDFVAFLANHAEVRRLEKDEVLFHYGEPAGRFYLVESGHVTVARNTTIGQ